MKPLDMDDGALEDIESAAAYLEEQREGLAVEFRDELDQAFTRIQNSPRVIPSHGNQGHRKLRLQKFSYTIFYLELEDRIWIASVAHHKRKPGYWMDRTPE